GFSATRTAKKVTAAATRSRPECAASERMPRLPLSTPTTILTAVRKIAATTDDAATRVFSCGMCAQRIIALRCRSARAAAVGALGNAVNGLEDVDRHREDDGRVLLGGDL